MSLYQFNDVISKNEEFVAYTRELAFLSGTSYDKTIEALFKAGQKIEHDELQQNDGGNSVIQRSELLSPITRTFTFGLGPALIKIVVTIDIKTISITLSATVSIEGVTVIRVGPIKLQPGKPVTIKFDVKLIKGEITFDISKKNSDIYLTVSIKGQILWKPFSASKTIKIWP
eukprot:344148_1